MPLASIFRGFEASGGSVSFNATTNIMPCGLMHGRHWLSLTLCVISVQVGGGAFGSLIRRSSILIFCGAGDIDGNSRASIGVVGPPG